MGLAYGSVFHHTRASRRWCDTRSLGLVVNAIVLWNTRYQNAALDQLRRDGHDVRDDDLRRLSPLGHDHLNTMHRERHGGTRSAGPLPDHAERLPAARC